MEKKFGPRDALEMPPLLRFEEQLRLRLADRYPGFIADQARRLQEPDLRKLLSNKKERALGKHGKQSIDEARKGVASRAGGQPTTVTMSDNSD